MGQQQSNSYSSTQTARAYPVNKNEQFYNKLIQHEGLLKLRQVPFKNCIQIQSQKGPLFIQNIEITLKDLLQSRLYTNKLFPKQDVQRLIQNITYTLAYLQQNKIPYKDVSYQNIFYDDGIFKLLPNQLIPFSRYQKFISSISQSKIKKTKNLSQQKLNTQSQDSKQFVTLPPQMIIAFRCKQNQISDIDILDKSNVFCLGLLILQVTTLLPSYQCYDTQTCDILDQVITERIQMVKQYYSQQIASIVANMLDYDYVQRMNLKDISIFINRQINKQLASTIKIKRQISNKKNNYIEQQTEQRTVNNQNPVQSNNQSRITKTQVSNKSRIFQHEDQTQSRISKPCSNLSTEQKRRQKTNKIYMNGSIKQEQPQQTFSRQDRNKVYLKHDLKKSNVEQKLQNSNCTSSILRQINNYNNKGNNEGLSRQSRSNGVKNNNINEKFKPSIPEYSIRPKKSFTINQQSEDEQYHTSQFSKSNASTKNNNDYLGYRANGAKTPKQSSFNHQKSRFQTQSQIQRRDFSKNKVNREQRELKDWQQNNRFYRDQNSFGYIKREDRNKIVSRQAFGSKQDSIAEDTGSRGYFMNQKVSSFGNQQNNDFKNQDHSLNRIKSQIQRSRKLIEEFKRGQKCQF